MPATFSPLDDQTAASLPPHRQLLKFNDVSLILLKHAGGDGRLRGVIFDMESISL